MNKAECSLNYRKDKSNLILTNIISSNAINKLYNNNDRVKSYDPLYNVSVTPHLKVTNQKSSGRCWLFAALNVIRREVVKKYDLVDFELSQNYLFFWDKFERINFNLNSIIETKDLDVNDRLVQHILSDPLCDGGQWDMIANLVNKYGLVPKSVYQESYHSSNSREMNGILQKKFREYAMNLRKSESPKKLLKEYMMEVYRLLCYFLGEPPSEFTWEYKNKKNEHYKRCGLTPLSFYKNMIPFNFDDYVCVINDPRKEHPYNNKYSIKYLGNVLNGNDITYLNLPINRVKSLVLKSLKDNNAVWYGCDVGKFLNKNVCSMSEENTNYLGLLNIDFNMTKEERLNYKDSLMTHAMVITGVNMDNEDNENTFNYWEVENSWSKVGPKDGYYSMTDTWFDEYVYEVAINKKYLNKEELDILSKDYKMIFDPWDPMGSLA